MKSYVTRWVAGFALVAMSAVTSVAIAATDDALAAAQAATSNAQAAAKAAMDAVQAANSGAVSDAGAGALAAAQAAAEAAMQAAEAAQAALDAATSAAATPAATPAAAPAAATTTAAASGDKPYEEHIQCTGNDCKIDLYLTRGFRAFSQCQVCHGLDANGSAFAPSLVDKLKEIDHARYVDVVTHGYKGQVGVMPAWETNPNVMKYMDQLYAYLKARSDGAIPSGKLKRYDR